MKFLATLPALWATSVVAFQDARKNMGGDRVLHVDHEHLSTEVRELLNQYDADHIGSHDSGLAIKLSPEAVAALGAAGVPSTDSTEEWIAHFQNNYDDPNFFCRESTEECAGRDLQNFYSSYQNLAALTSRIESAVSGSSLANRIQIGTSHEGRPIHVVEIGDSSKPLAYFMCNVHAREWLPSMYCPFMIESLLANGGHPLLDTFSFAIIPTGNPDGFQYSTSSSGNSMWRKNRKSNSGSSCVGTDLNRNYDDHWGGAGTSSNPCSDIYRGTGPFDCQETAAINNYANSRSNDLISWIDFHSYGSYWLSPLGYGPGLPPSQDYNRMSQCMSDVRSAIQSAGGPTYSIGGAANLLGSAAGASDDYFYFAYDVIYSFTAEMKGNSFQPSSSLIISNNNEIFAGMVAQMECIAEIELGGGNPDAPVSSPVPAPAPTGGTWICRESYYDAADGCDCDCGIPDPDCDLPNQILYNCNSGEQCVNGVCV